MTLHLLSDNNTVLQTTTTDSNGKYLFTNLTQGNYTVVVNTTTLPKLTLIDTYQKDGKNDSRTQVNLTVNRDILDIDFGYYEPPGKIIFFNKTKIFLHFFQN